MSPVPAESCIPPAMLDPERFMILLNRLAAGVITIDESLKIVLYNATALNILDLKTTIQTKPIGEVIRLYTKDNRQKQIEELIRTTKIPTITRDYLLHYHDASVANLYLSIAPVRLGYGQIGLQGFVLVLRDITKEKSLEEERDEFISVVSHELRTPITIAEGNVSNAQFTAQKLGVSAEIITALNEAHEQIIFLSEMINDLATLSRAERGRLSFEATPVNPHQLIAELVSNLRPTAEKQGISIQTDLNPHLELLHTSDLYLREILQNLLVNAIKYTEQGTVRVSAEPKEDGVVFSVQDSGIGISKGDQVKIFAKFFRSEDYRTRKTKGTGLGLYVTKKLVTLIHGDIALESELNHGSTFRVYVPNLV